MVQRIKKSHLLIMILLLVLLVPGGIALAGSSGQASRYVGTQTVTPTIAPIITPTPSVQQTPASTPFAASQIPGLLQINVPVQLPETTDTFTFEDFGFDEITMRGPFAANGYYFDLPLTWKMKQGAMLRLVLDTFYTGTSTDLQKPLNLAYGGTLLVQYNYINIATIDLDQEGRKQVDVPISLDALTRLGGNKGQSIQLILDSGINCDVNFRTTVVVRSISQLYLPHDMIDPPVDLRFLPSPFYQNSFNQDSVIIVVPDQPTESELQAALSISAGFGRMTFNRLLIALVPISQIPADVLANTNLIFVGKAEGLPLLQQVSRRAPLLDGPFAAEDSSPADGIVQMAISPWNKNKVVMVVGGNDDGAVVNAARAISTGMLRVGSDPSLSLVSNVQSVAPLFSPTDVNQTFEDLGYESIVVSEVGLNTALYTFNVPPSYALGPEAYLDLVFSHTALLEYQRSNIVVKLNDQPIGSVSLSDETVGQGNAKILLPASAVRPGSNSLRLDIDLEARNVCVNPLLDGLWMRIDSSSSLHLPFVPNPASASILVDLSKYPSPFAFDPVMNDLAFVLAPNDPIGWNVAAQIAFSLGNTNAIQFAGLEAFYADSVPEAVRQERNLIIVGKPSNLEILSELYDVLPAPFEPGSDLAIEKNLQVSYHLGAGADVGYLELLSAPWNSKRTILYAGGSSDLGVRWAGAALQFGRLRGKLSGNLSFISGEQIVTADTRALQGVQDVLASAAPVDLTPESSQLQPVVVGRPVWIIPAIFTVLGGILIVFIILGVQAVSRRRPDK